MPNLTALHAKRERLFSLHEKGAVTTSEVVTGFVDLLLDASDDDSSLQLCAGLPSWFSAALRDALNKMSKANYYARTFFIGDTRTPEEIHQDALSRQKILSRLAPKIVSLNDQG